MEDRTYSTKQIADLTGVHPNTVRLYEEWGYISKAERKDNHYRVFKERHLLEMRLARLALPGPYPFDGELVHLLVKRFAAGDMDAALAMAEEYRKRVDVEWSNALKALEVLDKWHADKPGDREKTVCRTRRAAAARLDLTVDTVRTWERNGLLWIGKDERGKMRFSEWDMEKTMIVRLLRNCGYSIASLNQVLAPESELTVRPSEILKFPDPDSDINYITDKYLDFLKAHKERSEAIIGMIRRFNRQYDDGPASKGQSNG